jgi:hypothetical protein
MNFINVTVIQEMRDFHPISLVILKLGYSFLHLSLQ